MGQRLICTNCKQPIQLGTVGGEPKYIHKLSGNMRCDGLPKTEKGFEKALKAQPLSFKDYLEQIEQLNQN